MTTGRKYDWLAALDRSRNKEILPPNGHGDIEGVIVPIAEPRNRSAIAIGQRAFQNGLNTEHGIAAAADRIIRMSRDCLPIQRPCERQTIENHRKCNSALPWLEGRRLPKVLSIAIEAIVGADWNLHRRITLHLVAEERDITCRCAPRNTCEKRTQDYRRDGCRR